MSPVSDHPFVGSKLLSRHPLTQTTSGEEGRRRSRRREEKSGMPTLNLYTNVPVDAVITSDILKDATKAVAKIIGKPESYVMIVMNSGVPMAFAGTEEPAAFGELISIGGLGPSVNGKLSSTIAEILQTKASIDSSRFYIKFHDVERPFFGYNGSTF
ncbi:Macrophage migration inhibitory factor homolog [Linum grandiflorum]